MTGERARSLLLLGALLTLATLVALFLLRPDSAPTRAPETQSAAPSRTHAPPPSPPPAPVEEAPPAPVELEPRTPHEEALAALVKYSGDGLVRCSLPPDLPRTHLNWPWLAEHTDQGLILPVTEVEGSHMLTTRVDGERSVFEPVVLLRWSGAEPGLLGHCEALPLEEVALEVLVLDEEDEPVEGAKVTVHPGTGGPQETNAHGRARAKGWRGATTRVSAMVDYDFPHMGRAHTSIVVDQPTTVQLRLETTDMLAIFDEDREEPLEAEGRYVEPMEQALEEETLSDEARELLERWRAERMDLTDDLLERSDRYGRPPRGGQR